MADTILEGHCAVFYDQTIIAGAFREQIAKGAFSKSLRNNDIVMLVDHDGGRVLGRTSAGTLALEEDATGLRFRLKVDPTTPEGASALGTVRRQDVKGCSFAGVFRAEEWDDGGGSLPLRTVTEVDLIECTLTAFPAYPTTTAMVAGSHNRSAERCLAAMKLRGIAP